MARVIRAARRGPSHLPAAEYEARGEAAAIVQDARLRAATLCESAVAEGIELGRAGAAALLCTIAKARARVLDEAEAAAVDAAILIAQKLVGEGFAADRTRVANLVAPLLARVRHAERVVVRLHPEDRTALYEGEQHDEGAAWLRRLGVAGEVDLVEDPTLARGGCVVQSQFGTLDARVETRLAVFARALREGKP